MSVVAPNPTIGTITLPPYKCPVHQTQNYDNDTLLRLRDLYRAWYTTEETVVWSKDKIPPPQPIVLGKKDAKIFVTISSNPPAAGKFKIKCSVPAAPVPEFNITRDGHRVEITILNNNKPLPWVLNDDIKISLHRADDTQIVEATFKQELFVVHDQLWAGYINSGIPRSLLTFQPLWKEWKANPTEWPAYVITFLTKLPGLRYNFFGGDNRYCRRLKLGETDGIEFEVWLELFLSDQIGIQKRNDSQISYLINCFDTAYIAQAIMFLGVDCNLLQAAYLKNYGYIQPTRLIGHTVDITDSAASNKDAMCDNPYYGQPSCDPKMLAPGSKSKGAFGTHMFLTLGTVPNDPNALVYDACCGPQLGKLTKANYCDVVIDKKLTLEKNTAVGSPVKECWWTGKGLVDLSSVITYAPQNETKGLALVNALNLKFNPTGESNLLLVPCLGTYLGRAVSTYTFKPKPIGGEKQDTIVLNLYLFSAKPSRSAAAVADEDMTYRLGLMSGLTPLKQRASGNIRIKEASSDASHGSFTILSYTSDNPAVGCIVTVASSKRKAANANLATFRTELEGVLLTELAKPLLQPRVPFVDAQPDTVYTVGQEIVIKFKNRRATPIGFWRGYHVACPNGVAILREEYSTVEDVNDELIIFKFVARKVAKPAIIEIRLFDGNLTSWPAEEPYQFRFEIREKS